MIRLRDLPGAGQALLVATLLALLVVVTVVQAPSLRAGFLLMGVLLAWLAKVPRWAVSRWLFVTVSCALVVVLVLVQQPQTSATEDLLQSRYSHALERLRAQGEGIAETLSTEWPRSDPGGQTGEVGEAGRLGLFQLAQRALASSSGPGNSIFIVDTDGVAEAWAGSGFRHALPETELPESGFFVLRSFTASTLGFVTAVTEASGGQRLVVGTSFSSTQLPEILDTAVWLRPFTKIRVPAEGGRLWAIRDVEGSGNPELRLREGIEAEVDPDLIAVSILGLISLLAVGSLIGLARRFGTRLTAAPESRDTEVGVFRGSSVLPEFLLMVLFPLALITVAVVSQLMHASVGIALYLFVGIALLAVFLRRWTLTGGARGVAVFLFSLGVLGSLWLAASDVLLGVGALDLRQVGMRFDIPLELTVLSLACWGAVAVVLAAMAKREGRPWRPFLLVCSGTALVLVHLLASSLAGALLIGLSSLLLNAGLTPCRVRGWVALAVGTSLVTASAWSVVVADLDRQELQRIASPTSSSFSSEGRRALRSEIEEFLLAVNLDDLTLGLEQRDSQAKDLALLLWLASPLSEASGPSGLKVTVDGRTEFFGFGLAVDRAGEVGLKTAAVTDKTRRWANEALVYGSVEVLGGRREFDTLPSRRSAKVDFFAIPTPTLRETGKRETSSLTRRFLLGELFAGSRWPAGFAVTAGPWDGEPGVILGRNSQVRKAQRVQQTNRPNSNSTEANAAVAEQWFEESFSLVRFYPPVNPYMDRFLRTAVQVSYGLVVALCLVFFLGLGILARRRSAAELLGPFSRRLILAFALLASVPIVLLSALLIRSFSERLQTEQRADGEAALSSAERMIGDYLSSLDPGFSVTAVLDDDLLSWISSIVDHEVNLYWRGNVLTSSRPELFSAGLLPSQMPGDVFAALDLEGRKVAARFNRSDGDTQYLELYRRVQLPGDSGGFGLFVSVPMLAQELETTFALRTVLNQALVLTTFLILLLVVVAVRFAELLTKPITEIVAGTQRIGSGDTALGLTPRIPELQRLAHAIDEMASKIASGRERLLREKRVVDTVIANIKSAVVSFGENETVILSNRVAADLLHVRPGDSLEDLAARIESKELARIVRLRPTVAERTSVRLGDSEDGQEWIVQWLPISGVGDPSALLVMEDVTEVLRAQRLAAWAEMARIIAHEIKNPLTPIRLSADHLRQVYETSPERLDEVFDRCIDNILVQVDELRLIAGEFSTYSRIPTSNKSLADLGETVRDVLESYRSGASDELAFTDELVEGEVLLEHDRRLIGRVLRNLYENGIRACGGKGRVHLTLEIKTGDHAHFSQGAVLLEVRDSGPGVLAEDLPRIFEPSFSASTGGTGLGLPIARSIVNDHGGQILASNPKEGLVEVRQDDAGQKGDPSQLALTGLRVSIHLPLDSRVMATEAEVGEST